MVQIFLFKNYLKINFHLTFIIMRNLLYVVAVILIIGWLLGAFAYSAGGLIHILLVLAIISLILGFIRRGNIWPTQVFPLNILIHIIMETLILIIILGMGALVMSSFLFVDNSQEDFRYVKKNLKHDDFFRRIKTNAHRIR